MSTFDGDVAVVGVGSIGSMALWRLASRGAVVHGYEQFGIGHHYGAAGGQTRRFSTLSQREPRNTPLALDALGLWRELERRSHRSLLTMTGGVVYGPEGSDAVQASLASARANDLEHHHLDGAALRRRFPQHDVPEGFEGVIDRLSGFVRPEASVIAATQAARADGAQVFSRTAVSSVTAGDAGVEVRTAEGSRQYRAAVVAPGAWAQGLLPSMMSAVTPRRLLQAWYVPDRIADFAPDVFPVFERVGDMRAYGFPTVDGVTVKVGVYTREHPVVADMAQVEHEVSAAETTGLSETVHRLLPHVHPDPVTVSVHVEGYSDDGDPLLGPLPDRPGLLTACGFSGAGFKFAPVFGDIVADHVLDGGTTRDVGYMLPGRVTVSG